MDRRGKGGRRHKKPVDFLMYFPYAETLLPFQPAALKHKGSAFRKPFRHKRHLSSDSNSSREEPKRPSKIDLASKIRHFLSDEEIQEPDLDEKCADLVTVAQLISPQKSSGRQTQGRGNWIREHGQQKKFRLSMTPQRAFSPTRNDSPGPFVRSPLRLPLVKKDGLSVISESITQSTPALPALPQAQAVPANEDLSESESLTQLPEKPKTCKVRSRKQIKIRPQPTSPRPKSHQIPERKAQLVSATVDFKPKGNTSSGQHREHMLDILLRNRTSLDHALLMQEYVKRLGQPEQTRVFILNSQDEYIRRAFKRRGWYENKVLSSTAFHLKWTYSDSEPDYRALRPGQLFNHFSNNRKLTTKYGLNSTFRTNCDFQIRPDTFYPRTYDLGEAVQVEELRQDYERTAAIGVIKQHAEYFLYLRQRSAGEEVSVVNIACLRTAMRHSKQLLRDLKDKCERNSKYVFIPDTRRSYIATREDWQYLMAYSKLRLPISTLTEEIKALCGPRYDWLRSWTLPTIKLQEKCLLIHNSLLTALPQCLMEGSRNVWIVKPGQNARGSGVHCCDELEEIVDCGAGMQARIVQKYIERPLLLEVSKGAVKFDIRQWVLVTSFDPVEIFYFNSCYLRLCSQPFTLDDLKTRYSHLANYSVQKSVSRVADETVWSLGQFLVYLAQFHPSISWKDCIQPQLHSLILNTLKCVTDEIDYRPGCFELYGFDIILDESLKPWLLEVNLSPACAERTPWLTTMLDSMGDGLLNVVLDGERTKPVVGVDGKWAYPEGFKVDTFEWLYLYRGEESPAEGKDQPPCSLEIVGEKLNLRRARQLEKKYIREQASILIQKVMRGFLVRNRSQIDAKVKAAVTVQRNIRTYLAQNQLKRLKEAAYMLSIQRVFRRFVAGEICTDLRLNKAATKLQALQRQRKAKEELKFLRETRCAELTQRVWRQRIAREELLTAREFDKKLRKVQRWVKSRHEEKVKGAIVVQKHFRGLKGRRLLEGRKREVENVRKVQAIVRRFLAFQAFNAVKTAQNALILQSVYRAFISNLQYRRLMEIKAACVIKRHYQSYQTRKSTLSLRRAKAARIQAATYIKAHIKGFRTRQTYSLLRRSKAAVSVQKLFRGHIARLYCRELRERQKAAVLIQKHAKGMITRKQVKEMLYIKAQEKEQKILKDQQRREKLARGMAASERLASRHSPITDLSAQNAALEASFKSVKRRLSARNNDSKLLSRRDYTPSPTRPITSTIDTSFQGPARSKIRLKSALQDSSR